MKKNIMLALLVAAGMVSGAQATYDTAGGEYAAREAYADGVKGKVAQQSAFNNQLAQKRAQAQVKQAEQQKNRVAAVQAASAKKFNF